MSKEQNKALFYTQSKEEVLKELDSSIEGLSTAQAQERLATYAIMNWTKVKNVASCLSLSISLKI